AVAWNCPRRRAALLGFNHEGNYMSKTIRILLLAAATIALACAGATAAIAQGPPTAPPGHSGDNPGSPGDDCSHGASGKTCKDDPQPEHGNECADHGNASGNEDHCGVTTTEAT